MSKSVNNELNWTLEDGRWKDSFDKFIEEKSNLRKLNILKKNVRASFNNDSSIENSRNASGFQNKPKQLKKKIKKAISTPMGKTTKHPFRCKISPIHVRTNDVLFGLNNSKVKKQKPISRDLQSTVLQTPVGLVEYSSIKQNLVATNSNAEDSLDIFLKNPKKAGKLTRKTSCNAPVKAKDIKKQRNIVHKRGKKLPNDQVTKNSDRHVRKDASISMATLSTNKIKNVSASCSFNRKSDYPVKVVEKIAETSPTKTASNASPYIHQSSSELNLRPNSPPICQSSDGVIKDDMVTKRKSRRTFKNLPVPSSFNICEFDDTTTEKRHCRRTSKINKRPVVERTAKIVPTLQSVDNLTTRVENGKNSKISSEIVSPNLQMASVLLSCEKEISTDKSNGDSNRISSAFVATRRSNKSLKCKLTETDVRKVGSLGASARLNETIERQMRTKQINTRQTKSEAITGLRSTKLAKNIVEQSIQNYSNNGVPNSSPKTIANRQNRPANRISQRIDAAENTIGSALAISLSFESLNGNKHPSAAISPMNKYKESEISLNPISNSMVTVRKNKNVKVLQTHFEEATSSDNFSDSNKKNELIKSGQNESKRRALRSSKSILGKNVSNPAPIRNAQQEAVDGLHSILNAMITVRKSKSRAKYRSSGISEPNVNNIDSLATSDCSNKTIETRRSQSNRRSSMENKTAISANSAYMKNATTKAQSVERLSENLQDFGDISSINNESENNVLSRISAGMVTIRKSNNNQNYFSSCLEKESLQNDEEHPTTNFLNEKIEKRQSQTIQSNDSTQNTIEAVSLTVQSTESLAAKVLTLDNVDIATGNFKRISNPLVTVRKSSNSSTKNKPNCVQEVQGDAETIGSTAFIPLNNPSTEEVQENPTKNAENSFVQRIIENTTSNTAHRIRFSKRTSNPMKTVRRSRQELMDSNSTKAENDCSQFISVKNAKPSKKFSIQLNTENNTRDVSVKTTSGQLKPLSPTCIVIESNTVDNMLTDLIECSLNSNENFKVSEKSATRRVSKLTIDRRKNRIQLPSSQTFTELRTKRSLKKRSFGRALNAVQEVISENEPTEQHIQPMATSEDKIPACLPRKMRTVQFIDRPAESIDRERNSKIVFLDTNDQIERTLTSLENTRRYGMPTLKAPVTIEPSLKPNKSENYSENINEFLAGNNSRNITTNISLQPGKWRKSLSLLRRSQMSEVQVRQSSRYVSQLESIMDEGMDESVEFMGKTTFIGKRKTILIKSEEVRLTQKSFTHFTDYREHVLQYCNQSSILSFEKLYGEAKMQNCLKIGEGVYGEVFMKKAEKDVIVCKIIPIEGSMLVNGEVQKTFEQILPEIVISKELSGLKDAGINAKHTTSGFVDVKKVACVQGKYPEHLIKCWDAYDKEKTSENDNPKDLPKNQVYIVLELEFAGKDIESFVFLNAEQSYAAFQQIVLALAVAEECLEFEHRDLHLGNVLIRQTTDLEFEFKFSDRTLVLPTKGIKATIIDYTLSRMKCDCHCFYNDLANEEDLFTATGDYQFDIYRMMRDVIGSNWERFEPKTNVFWLSFIISKMESGIKYKNTRSKIHAEYLRKFRTLKNEILDFCSASLFAKHMINKS